MIKTTKMDKPKIVCICGSTRFYDEFQDANLNETMAGNIVLTVGVFGHCAVKAHRRIFKISEREKTMLDDLHKSKIKIADEVFVLNVGRYIGKSCKLEIEYARSLNKPVRYLESINTHKG